MDTRVLMAEFYQFVLAAVYQADGFWGDATFDLYARGLPSDHGYLIAAGIEPFLEELEALTIPEALVELLQKDPRFSKVPAPFFDRLARFRFEGEVWAVPEGTPVFPQEPILRITAPLAACTLLETRVIQAIATPTAIATRASRMVEAGAGRRVMDFGSRRCPDPASAVAAARAAFVGGASATTNAHAALMLGIPPMGTMSDTFLAAYGNDRLAVQAFRHHFPGLCHLALSDEDLDTPQGLTEGIARLLPFKDEVVSVRIDHPDLARVAPRVRAALDAAGMSHVKLLGSGHLDEARIAALAAAGVPVDWLAVGRALAQPSQEATRMAFRIAEMTRGIEPTPVTREGSAPYPGRKQILRFPDRDVLCLEQEAWSLERLGGRPLLVQVMEGGQRIYHARPLGDLRERRARELAHLTPEARQLHAPAVWPVEISDALAQRAKRAH